MEYEKLLNAVIGDLDEEKERVSKGYSTLDRGCKEYGETCKQYLIDYAENEKNVRISVSIAKNLNGQ